MGVCAFMAVGGGEEIGISGDSIDIIWGWVDLMPDVKLGPRIFLGKG